MHKVDKMGYPLDPELKALEVSLEDLAGAWRGAYGDTKKQQEIVGLYHATVKKLYEKGWDGFLDVQSELPVSLMPQEYLERHPHLPWKP
jgi:hypothetical protein